MGKRVGWKIGDTLIEVMFAIGIFSLVAISVVAVMNGGTSNVQTALETTMARNTIDEQAEALRFIHSSYTAEKSAGVSNGEYTKLWKSIVGRAKSGIEITDDLTQFSPATCAELYDKGNENSIYSQNAFVINTQRLGSNPNNALEKAQADTLPFQATSLYPRLIFGGETTTLAGGSLSDVLTSAEGIYVVAVYDPGSVIVEEDGTTKGGTYYDFYIRSCWYGLGAKAPSTISTVIRLYDPDMRVVDYELSTFQVHLDLGDHGGDIEVVTTAEDKGAHDFDDVTVKVSDDVAKEIIGFSTQNPAEGTVACSSVDRRGEKHGDIWETKVNVGEVYAQESENKTIYAIDECLMTVTYDANGGSYWEGDRRLEKTTTTENITVGVGTQNVQVKGLGDNASDSRMPKRTGYKIAGWTYPSPNAGSVSWRPTVTVTMCALSSNGCTESMNPTVYAAWDMSNQYISVVLNWWPSDPSSSPKKGSFTVNPSGAGQYADLDSYISGTDDNGKGFEVWYSNLYINKSTGKVLAYLNNDSYDNKSNSCRTSDGMYEEITELNTAGGKSYSYYVKNYSNKTQNIEYAVVDVKVYNGEKSSRSTTCSVTGNGEPVAWRRYVINGNSVAITGVDEYGNSVNENKTVVGSGARLTLFEYLDEHFNDKVNRSSY